MKKNENNKKQRSVDKMVREKKYGMRVSLPLL
jgi:hypothetical protein